MKETYLRHWHFFNVLISDVRLSREQLNSMFNNLTKAEIRTWAKEIAMCYVGSEKEEETANIRTAEDLAKFYYENPVIM